MRSFLLALVALCLVSVDAQAFGRRNSNQGCSGGSCGSGGCGTSAASFCNTAPQYQMSSAQVPHQPAGDTALHAPKKLDAPAAPVTAEIQCAAPVAKTGYQSSAVGSAADCCQGGQSGGRQRLFKGRNAGRCSR